MHLPKSLELVLATNESITIDLDPLPAADEIEVVMDMLVEEKPPAFFWTALASRCWNAVPHCAGPERSLSTLHLG